MPSKVLRRRLMTLLAGCAAVGSVATGCGADDPAGFDGASREAFITACVEDDDNADLAGVCECTYDLLERTLSFERFAEVDAAVAVGDPLPDEVVAAIDECISIVSRDRG